MRNHRNLVAAGLALVGALVLAACTNNFTPMPTPEPTETTISTDTYTEEQLNEFMERYTFHEFSFECPTDEYGLVKTDAYAHSKYGPSSSGDGPKRLYSDSVSLPLVDGTPEEQWEAFKVNLCTDTFLAFSWGYVLGNEVVPGTDTRVFDLEFNEGLAMADVDIEEINNLADSMLFKRGGDLTEWLDANMAYQFYVNTLVAILGQFELFGVHSLESSQNWHLVPLSAGIGDLEENEAQESLPALLFGVSLKGQCEPSQLYGVNLDDQRPEKFDPSKLGCVPEETPPTTVVCQVNCGGTPVCQANCGGPGKNPARSSTLVVDPVIPGPAGAIDQGESTKLQVDPIAEAAAAAQAAAAAAAAQQQQHQQYQQESTDVSAPVVEEGSTDSPW